MTRLTLDQYKALNKTTAKYGSIKINADGHKFDSLAEYERYKVLKLKESAGEIYRLDVHTKFYLQINYKPYCTYISDFDYLEIIGEYWQGKDISDMSKKLHSRYIVEDVKAVRTAAYQLKKKALFLDKGITITEINVLKKRKRDVNIKIEQNNLRQKRTATTRVKF
jgi:hypothetical protein